MFKRKKKEIIYWEEYPFTEELHRYIDEVFKEKLDKKMLHNLHFNVKYIISKILKELGPAKEVELLFQTKTMIPFSEKKEKQLKELLGIIHALDTKGKNITIDDLPEDTKRFVSLKEPSFFEVFKDTWLTPAGGGFSPHDTSSGTQ